MYDVENHAKLMPKSVILTVFFQEFFPIVFDYSDNLIDNVYISEGG